jgi:hypothetical protein
VRWPITFNHGVVGSSPTALTNKIKYLVDFRGPLRTVRVGNVLAKRLPATEARPA